MRLLRALAILVLARRGRAARAAARPEAELPRTVEREVTATRGGEWAVLAALGLTVLGAAGFVLTYVFDKDTQLFGLFAGIALVGLALACGIAGKRLVPQEIAEGEYHDHGDPAAREDVAELVASGGEGVSRRRLLLGAAGAAGASVAAAAIVPAASLGPQVGDRLARTPWRTGRRLVRDDGSALRADDVRLGQMVMALPEGADPRHDLTASVNVLRLAQHELQLPPDRLAAAPSGVVAYSRICTHAGCAVSMLRYPLYGPHHPRPGLVCPCHYSTFDPLRGAAVEFGPAARPLPQLPLRVNAAGELEAAGDFFDRPGPTYDWVRER